MSDKLTSLERRLERERLARKQAEQLLEEKSRELYVTNQELRKLYPDAELPTFATSRPDDDTMVMVYQSRRPFADLAHGLIEGCITHYDEPVNVESEDLSNDGRTHVRFTLTRQ